MGVNWKAFVDQISHYQSFVLVSHIRPDCDALGSELAMAEVLRAIGKDVRIINAHRTPPALQFLDPAGNIDVLGDDVEAEDIHCDCFMILDTSAWAQLGDMGDVIRTATCDKMVLDHHVGEDDLGATMFKDYQAEATGHLVIQAADACNVPLTRKMGVAAFAAIATDTGWFRFGSVTPETFRVISRLVEVGVVPSEVYGDLYERDTLGRLKLRGLILSRTEAELDGALVHTYVQKEDFAAMGAEPSDTEDAINLTLSVGGTKGAVIFVGQLRGGYKLSFRSRCDMDCNEIARQFGGGGHKAAAGAFVEGTLAEAQERVLPVVRQAMQKALGL
ncbi:MULTISPECIES: DHH family phosphoesterase [Crateriforma]|uniref:NanoRNase/pAp phosphatase n=1 Tax=Crateriforma conspicua TaxID=2527996 RepID=A0A5C5Y6K0_9PLAN|nr:MULTISPECIES: DHH family phosphoesterase [Crateriforma]QDV65488.1 NanoRNase/pAp phosphatase [Crateriforma conspicua]TWT70880.1 NanoRNase/pAp phosphatase [Crateriforma conspicua]TWU65177.1 NanoRNase/pAp phosphatase [Crateriforma conspicua]